MLSHRLRYRLQLQAPVTQQNAYGEPAPAWQDIARFWADITPWKGKEIFGAGAAAHPVLYRLRQRHREDVQAGMRVVHQRAAGDVIYHIEALLAVQDRELHLLCSTGLRNDSALPADEHSA